MQDGLAQYDNDVKSDHQGKALQEGCCERTKARMGVSSKEKTVTNKDLTRVMVKTLSWMQTVTNGHVSWIEGI